MEIKQFTAPTVAAAAAEARRALGPDAVVLQSRRIAGPGWRRYLRRFDRVQLTMVAETPLGAAGRGAAAPGPRAAAGRLALMAREPVPGAPASAGAGSLAVRTSGGGASGVGAPAVGTPAAGASGVGTPAAGAWGVGAPAFGAPAARAPAVGGSDHMDPAATPPSLPASGAPGVGLTPEAAAARPIAGRGMRPRLLLTEAPEQECVRERLLRTQMAGRTNLGPPQPVAPRAGSRRVVVLVGPTGAGKTTTAAKLAALLQLQQGWRVALVTADTFRVGAVEQLGAYARVLGTTLEVAATPRALERVLPRCTEADVVLVDTAGRGHRDRGRMEDLAAMLAAVRAAEPDGVEVHLVLPATLGTPEAESMLAAYRGLGADRLLPTKLDECEDPARLLDLAGGAGMPLSYWTAGQRVPEDIAVAWPDELVAWAEDSRVRAG
ncbi:MAG TPA: hypothetical protein VNM16_11010 [Bacillota bacterium]|nr:hypothetical protein [Bacillota bacterium]